MAYAEALTKMSSEVVENFQPYHDALTAHFNEAEVLEIVGVVVNMNIWTRLKLAEGATPTLVTRQ
ncbi:MAG: hypothetical protein R2706_08530 [Acidimicrobiales bacterium]